MEYFNLSTKEIKVFNEKEFELLEDVNSWIEYAIVKDKIVLVSLNNYKVFPKDELGFNKDTVLKLLEFYKPATRDSALKIAKYYRVCPYCLSQLSNSNNIILDCREDFHNIKKMQMDLYYEISCCQNSYLVAIDKTLSNRAKAKYIEEILANNDMLIVVVYKLEHRNIEIHISLEKLLEIFDDKKLDIQAQSNFKILQEIFNNNLYLCVKKNSEIIYDNIDNIKMEVLRC